MEDSYFLPTQSFMVGSNSGDFKFDNAELEEKNASSFEDALFVSSYHPLQQSFWMDGIVPSIKSVQATEHPSHKKNHYHWHRYDREDEFLQLCLTDAENKVFQVRRCCHFRFQQHIEKIFNDTVNDIENYKKAIVAIQMAPLLSQSKNIVENITETTVNLTQEHFNTSRTELIVQINKELASISALDMEIDSMNTRIESTSRLLGATQQELAALSSILPMSVDEVSNTNTSAINQSPVQNMARFPKWPLQPPQIICTRCSGSEENNENFPNNPNLLVARGVGGLRLCFALAITSPELNLGWAEVDGAWVGVASLLQSLRSLAGLSDAVELQWGPGDEETVELRVLPASGRVLLQLSPSVPGLGSCVCLQGGILSDRKTLLQLLPSSSLSSPERQKRLRPSECVYLQAVLLFAAAAVTSFLELDGTESGCGLWQCPARHACSRCGVTVSPSSEPSGCTALLKMLAQLAASNKDPRSISIYVNGKTEIMDRRGLGSLLGEDVNEGVGVSLEEVELLLLDLTHCLQIAVEHCLQLT